MKKSDFRGAWEEIKLSPEADGRIRRVLENACSETEKEDNMRKANDTGFRRKAPRTAIIALAAALALSVTAVAVAAARVNMNVTEYPSGVDTDEAYAEGAMDFGEATVSQPHDVEISFDAVDGEYIELGSWYPQSVPAGYEEAFVSDPASANYRNQHIIFENAEGKHFDLEVQTGGEGLEIYLDGVTEERSVSINGLAGTLYGKNGVYWLLAWADEERGLGFTMGTDDGDIDLVAIAESVAETDEAATPTLASKTEDALAELGDYAPAALPDGYEENGTTGIPLEDGSWYAYVRRYYENDAHDTVYFAYETFYFEDEPNPTADMVLDCDAQGTDVTVNGMPGRQASSPGGGAQIWWVDMENSLLFTIKSDAVAPGELLTAANSVAAR